MDYKAIIAAFLDLIKDFLKLVGLDDEAEKIEGDINHILGKDAE